MKCLKISLYAALTGENLSGKNILEGMLDDNLFFLGK
jgi:hypothetical protein